MRRQRWRAAVSLAAAMILLLAAGMPAALAEDEPGRVQITGPDAIEVGTPVLFTAEAKDADGSAVTEGVSFTWAIERETAAETAILEVQEDTSQALITGEKDGTIRLMVVAESDSGDVLFVPATADITIQGTAQGYTVSMAPTSADAKVGDVVHFTASAAPTGNTDEAAPNDIQYTWTVRDGDDAVSLSADNGAEIDVTASKVPAGGTVTIEVRATIGDQTYGPADAVLRISDAAETVVPETYSVELQCPDTVLPGARFDVLAVVLPELPPASVVRWSISFGQLQEKQFIVPDSATGLKEVSNTAQAPVAPSGSTMTINVEVIDHTQIVLARTEKTIEIQEEEVTPDSTFPASSVTSRPTAASTQPTLGPTARPSAGATPSASATTSASAQTSAGTQPSASATSSASAAATTEPSAEATEEPSVPLGPITPVPDAPVQYVVEENTIVGGKIVTGIPIGADAHSALTVQLLYDSMESEEEATVQVLTAQGEPAAADAPLSTGMVVCVTTEDGEVTTAVIVVRGDVLGNGVIGLSQLVRVASSFSGRNPLEGAYLVAGDISRTGSITLTDLVMEAAMLRAAQPS